jgi:hypothetical protein
MSSHIIEILSVNLPKEMKSYRMGDRFVAWLPGEAVSEPTSFPDAVRAAIALGDKGCIGFVCDEPAPAVPVSVDYSKPLPGILSRKKRAVPDKTSE